MNSHKGFTLIELLVVVLIVGILASVGMPKYNRTVEVSRITDGFGIMMMIGTAQQTCWLDNRKYADRECPGEAYLDRGSGVNEWRPALVKKGYISDQKWGKAVIGRHVYFGTSAMSSHNCSAVGMTLGLWEGENDISACMYLATPNSWNNPLTYYVRNSVCREWTGFPKGAPKCPR